MNLITLEEAKQHLYVDHDADDEYILAQIAAASGAILNYLKGAPIGQPDRDEQGAIMLDSSGDPIYQYDSNGLVIRYEIQAAVKILLGELYKNREATQDGRINEQAGYGFLPYTVISLLYPLRMPALA